MPRPSRFGSLGFTLTEVLVALAIGAALTATAAPALVDLAAQREQIESSDRLAASLRAARNQAVFGAAQVAVCGADTSTPQPRCTAAGNDWSGGWIVFVEATPGSQTSFDPAQGDRLLFTQPALESGAALVAVGGEVNAVRFQSDGSVRRGESALGTTLWKVTTSAGAQRWVCLSPLGRVAVSSTEGC